MQNVTCRYLPIATFFLMILPCACRERAAPAGHKEPSTPPARPPAEDRPATPDSVPSSASQTGGSTDGELVIAGIVFSPPQDWVAEPPKSGMRKAQFSIPGEAGAVELSIYYFGANGAGSRQANIDRWVSQFKNPGDSATPAESVTQTASYNGLEHTVVTVTGSFAPASMAPGAPAPTPQENAALFGVIIEGGPQGPLYLKAVGPEATLHKHTAALESFHRRAHPAK